MRNCNNRYISNDKKNVIISNVASDLFLHTHIRIRLNR